MRPFLPTARLATLLALAMLAACSKVDPAPAPPKPRTDGAPAARAAAPAADNDVDASLKERLARQEAAARMFDRMPEAAKALEAPRVEPAKREPPRTEPVKPEPPKAEPVRTEPAKVEAPRAAAKAEPAKAAPRTEPPKPVEAPKVAAVAPEAAAPVPAPAAAARVLSRVDPDFPREAVQSGADQGLVKARMTLDAAGNVTRVEVIEATPRRVFDRAVTRALSQWRFDEGASGRTVETEVAFRR